MRHYRSDDSSLWPAVIIIGIGMVVAPVGVGLVQYEYALGGFLMGAGVIAAVLGISMVVGPFLRMPRVVNPAKAMTALAQIASEYGGITVGDGFGTMTRRGFPGRIEYVSGLRPSTDVSFAIEGAVDGHLQVTRESVGQEFRKAGITDFEVGHKLFDDIYRVVTSEPKTALSVLSRDICDTLVGLEKHFPIVLRVTPRSMMLRAEGHRYDWRELEPLVHAAFRVFDSLRLPEKESVEIVEAVQRTTEAMCDVCGSSMATGALVRCAKCRTPHHKDCWSFNGKCAVFGCGEVRSGA